MADTWRDGGCPGAMAAARLVPEPVRSSGGWSTERPLRAGVYAAPVLHRITSPPHGRGFSRLLLALVIVFAVGAVGACGGTSPSGPPAPLDLEGEGERAADAALAAAARDRHVTVRRARRLGVEQCRPDGEPDSDDVYCYVEFTAYPGTLRRFCTRTYRTTLGGEAATAPEGWEITCQRYGSRKSARAAREGKVSPEEARREARQRARREARARQ